MVLHNLKTLKKMNMRKLTHTVMKSRLNGLLQLGTQKVKNSLGNSDNENFNMNDQFKDPFEGTTIRESNKVDDML